MMLNHDDRRRLQEIEHELEREDPVLAQGLRQGWPRRTRRWPFVLLVILGALLAALGLAVFSLYLVAVGVACVVGGFVLVRRRSGQIQPRPE